METRVPAEEPEAATIARHTEMKILTEQISAVFLAHAAEFLGAIFVLKTEYSPMIRALSPLVRHAIAISGSQAPISEAAQSEVMEKNQ